MTRSVTELSEKLDLVLKKIINLEEKLDQHQPKVTHHISTQTEDQPKALTNIGTQTHSYSEAVKQPLHLSSLTTPTNATLCSPDQPTHSQRSTQPTPSTVLNTNTSTTSTNTTHDHDHPTNQPTPIPVPVSQSTPTEELQRHRRHLRCILNRRKLHFYQQLRTSELSDIHQTNLNHKPPVIPRKLKEPRTSQDSINTTKRKEKLELLKLQNHIEELQEQASIHLMKLQKEDKTAKDYMTSLHPTLATTLQHEWKKNVNDEEVRSVEIWSKKRSFFTSNAPYTPTPTPSPHEWQLVRSRNRQHQVFHRRTFPPPRIRHTQHTYPQPLPRVRNTTQRSPTHHRIPTRIRLPTTQPHHLPSLLDLEF